MAHAVLTHSPSSHYDDHLETRYHFPSTYLNTVRAALHDWVVFYEPRRVSGQTSSNGRQAYFAVAAITGVEPDPERPAHFYARISGYLEFDTPVPFSESGDYAESILRKADGSTNRGAFGRAVRALPAAEFEAIVRRGLRATYAMLPSEPDLADRSDEFEARPVLETLVRRRFRDVAFRQGVRGAYRNTCAVTGLSLINGGGRPEVQAAHIIPVEADGPDTVRNGLALTGTAHWLFDRGLISVAEDFRLLVSDHGVPEDARRLFRPDGRVWVPDHAALRPNPRFLEWHRVNRFKA